MTVDAGTAQEAKFDSALAKLSKQLEKLETERPRAPGRKLLAVEAVEEGICLGLVVSVGLPVVFVMTSRVRVFKAQELCHPRRIATSEPLWH